MNKNKIIELGYIEISNNINEKLTFGRENQHKIILTKDKNLPDKDFIE